MIRLLDGQASPVTTFWVSGEHSPIGLRLCRDGRLFNWANGRFGIYANGVWSQWDTAKLQARACFVDQGEELSLFADGKLHILDGMRGLRTLPVAEPGITMGMRVVPWGRDRVLAFARGEKELVAFSARNGECLDIGPINGKLGGRPIRYLFSLPDGSVWVVLSDYAGSPHFLCRIAPDGEVRLIRETVGLEWNVETFARYSGLVVAENGGRVWFADPALGVLYLDDQGIEQFAPGQDGSPANPIALALDRDGALYALDKNGLHVYNQGRSLTGGAPPLARGKRGLGQPVWQTRLMDCTILRARASGDTAFLSVNNPDRSALGAVGVDLRTGEGLFAVRQVAHDKPVCAGGRPGQFLLPRDDCAELWSVSPWVLHNRLPVGEIAARLAKARPTGQPPMWFPLLALPDGRCVSWCRTGILCVDSQGQLAWDRQMPGGFPCAPIAVAGDLLVVQADSSGGSLLCGIDLGTGKPRWAQKSTNRGSGVALFPDGQRLVEATRRGELTCRRSADGEAVWTYRRSGTELQTPPVLDSLARSVYAYFDDAVVCLLAETGQLVWEHSMAEPPFRADTREMLPGNERLLLADGVLLAVDNANDLVLLAAATGLPLAVFPLVDDDIRYGKRLAGNGLAGVPWLAGEKLVVPTATGLSAYRLPVAAYLPPAELPSASWAVSPPERIAGTVAEFAVAAKGTGELLLHYRLDSGEWHRQSCASPVQNFRVDGLTSGRHWLRFVVQDAAGRMSAERMCRFEVVADGPSEEEIVVTRSGPPVADPAARAEEALRRIGGEIHPRLAIRRFPQTAAEGGEDSAPVLCDFASLLPPEASALVDTASQPSGSAGIPEPPGAGGRYWERFPLPAGIASRITQVALDEGGGLWVMTKRSCFHWDAANREWRDSGLAFASGGSPSPGEIGEAMCGGPETGLYVAPFGDWRNPERKVYRLANGEARLLFTMPRKSLPLLPLRDGRLASLTTQELRVYADGQWRAYPLGSNPPRHVRAFDLGDAVCVCHDGSLLLVDAGGKTEQVSIAHAPDGNLTVFVPAVYWYTHHADLWGKDRALLGAPNDESPLRVLHLRSGKQEEASALHVALGDRRIRDRYPMADGSLLVTVHDLRARKTGLCRISADGAIRQLAVGVELPLVPLPRYSGCVADDAAGGVWLKLPRTDILHLGAEGWVRQFDPDADGSPVGASCLIADAHGVVYAVGEGYLYAYNLGKSLTGQGTPAPRRLLALGQPRWRQSLPGDGALDSVARVGDTAFLRPVCRDGACEVAAVVLLSGETRFRIPLPEGEKDWYSVGAGTDTGELTVRRSSGLVVLDSRNGTEIRTLSWLGEAKEDGHPLPLRQDRLFLPRRDGPGMPCFDQLGRKVWELDTGELGRLAELPAIHGDAALFQTRSPHESSLLYASLVDLDGGRVVWSRPNVLRGGRSAFLLDGERVVGFGSPDRRDRTSFGLVCLDTRSGEQRWACDLPAGAASGLAADAASRRIYLHFADGSVGCVDGDLGTLLWRTLLPHRSFAESRVWRMDSPSVITVDSGMVLVTDCTAVLTMLDMATGTILGHLRLTETAKDRGRRLEPSGLLVPPWVVAGQLVVATEKGLAAYPFPPQSALPPVESLALAWAAPPPDRPSGGAMDLQVSASGQGLVLKRRLGDGDWEQEPLVVPVHTVRLRGLAERRHRVRLVLAAADGRWSNELVHDFGEGEGGPREVALPAPPVEALAPDEVAEATVADSPHVPVPRAQREEDRYWEHFPAIPGQTEPISAVGIDAGNGVWILVGGMCWHWNRAAGAWVKLEPPEGYSWQGFFGGGKQGLFISCGGGTERAWKIHRLEAGKGLPVTEVRHPSDARQPPGFHLARDGRILSWSPSQFRSFAGGVWHEWEAKIGSRLAVFEHGDLVSMFSGSLLCTLDPEDMATRIPLDPSVALDPARWALLGGDRVLFIAERGRYEIQSFRLSDGHAVGTSGINRLVGRAEKPQHLVPLPDGSVLLLAYAPTENCQRVYRIRPDGSVEEEVAARGLPLAGSMDVSHTPMPLAEPGGRVWFPSASAGVSYWENGQFRQFDYRIDGSPFRAEALALDLDGVLYAAGGRCLYVYNQGTAVTGASRPAPCPVASLGEDIWHVKLPEKSQLYGAQRIGQSSAAAWLADGEARKLLVLELAEGKVGVVFPLADEPKKRLHPSLGRTPAEVTLCGPASIGFVDTATGKTLAMLPKPDDSSDGAPPLPLPDGYLLWPAKAGQWLVCRTATGEQVWRFPPEGKTGEWLRPYLLPGGHLIVQDGRPQRVGRTLWALDPKTGNQLWQVATGNNAGSLAPIDDSRFLTFRDTGQTLDSESWLTCWEAGSGRKLWEHRRPGNRLRQAPVYDPASRRVAVYFEDGTIACLDARNGKLRWERTLAQCPMEYRPVCWNPLFGDSLQLFGDSLQRIPGAVLAFDRTGDITVLNAYNGEVLARYGIGADVLSEGKRTGRRLPMTVPWLVGEQLIVCDVFSIRALPFPVADLQQAAAATRPEEEEEEEVVEMEIAKEPDAEPQPERPDKEIAVLVTQLGAARFAAREAARAAILKIGKAAIPYMQTRRDDPDPEIRAQVREILEALE